MKFICTLLISSFCLLAPASGWTQEGEEAPQEKNGAWADKLYGNTAATPAPEVATPTAQEAATTAEQELSEMQSELLKIDKELKEKGPQAMLDPAMAKKMMKAFSKNKNKNGKPVSPFSTMKEEEIEGMIMQQTESVPQIKDFFKKNPKFVTFIVRFFKSEDAFFGIIKIASQDQKLKLYFGTFIFLTLLSLLFNIMGSRNAPFWKRFLRKVMISIFITGLQFGALYFFFHEELKPTVLIAKEVFLSKT